jgi:hypothetical protein
VDESTYTAVVDALEAELARTVRLAELTEASLPIPTCPGWDAAGLWRHLGMVHRWAAEIVRTRSDVVLDRSSMDMHLPADDLWAPWLAEGADLLLSALRGSAADAALALGRDEELAAIQPSVAADGIDERLHNLTASLWWRGADAPALPGICVHLHATDDGLGEAGEWMVTLGGEPPVRWEHAHGKGDVAVRGPAWSLLLSLYGRLPADHPDLEIFGDPDVFARFREIAALG